MTAVLMDACICIEPDEFCQLLRKNSPTARRPHVCCECGETIEPGQVYLDEVTVCDGGIKTWKTCRLCWNIRKDMFTCGWYYGEIWDEIHNTFCDKEFCICPGGKHHGTEDRP